MTRQEKIRNNLAVELDKCDLGEWDTWVWVETANKILSYLDSQGVVLKAGNKLPTISYHSAYPENEEEYQKAMLKAGYVAVEPLIEK